MFKKKIILLIIIHLLCVSACSNKPFNHLDYNDCDWIQISIEYPPFHVYKLDEETGRNLIYKLNNLDLSKCKEINDIPVGDGTIIEIYGKENISLILLNPYIIYNGNCYKLEENDSLFDLIAFNQ